MSDESEKHENNLPGKVVDDSAPIAEESAKKAPTAAMEKEDLKKSLDVDEHLMLFADVCARYEVQADEQKPLDSKGLSSEVAAKRLETYGPNMMTPPKQVPLIMQYLISLSNMFNVMLIVSGILAFVVYAIDPVDGFSNLYIGPILILVAMLNALIEFVQEQKSKAILKSFMDMVPRKCMVIRDGHISSIEAMHLVPGDIVNIRMGDKIPADIVMFSASDFKVDNSSLTGESEPQERKGSNKHENPLEATNLIFNGTMAVNGEGFGVVIRTGDSTFLGQIANMAGSETKRNSPLSQEIDHFVHIIAAVAGVCAIAFFLGSVFGNPSAPIAGKINFAIGVFVSFVPEGLPATVTMLLSIAAKRMSKRNVLVKDLRGVETLGAITCLATDKTGTLTRNQMTVTYVWSGQKMYDSLANESVEKQDVEVNMEKSDKQELNSLPKQAHHDNFPLYDFKIPELGEMAYISYLCSKARFDKMEGPVKSRSITADATETGLFKFAAEAIPDSDSVRDNFPKVFEIPFNSANKWALTIHDKPHENGQYTLYIKGAPERIFRLCSSFVSEGNEIVDLGESHKTQFQKAYEVMASKGHRVLGCAKLLLPGDKFPKGFYFMKEEGEEDVPADVTSGLYPQDGYTFMGLVSLEDPPKHGVREAIGKCRQAGVKVMMVTGDHPLTAEAIARKINLMLQETKEMVAKRTNRAISSIQEHEYHAIVIHGEKIDSLTDEDWENILDKEEIIFARTSPKHKLQIVKRCQARGHIVGVTGDGVNDSPALKKADLGIAMNLSGSDVSKEAAAMILLDDNFASTVTGITEGRLIFQNLKKSIRYTITHTMPEVLANMLYLVVPLPIPIDPLQIIMIDLGFELFISLAYAWEPAEAGGDNLMKSLPRKPVTARSIDLLRRTNKALAEKASEIKRYVYGSNIPASETESEETMSFWTKTKFIFGHMHYFFAHLFDKKAWKLYMEPRDEEVLVDFDVLSYAYLEVGPLETIGCFIAFFIAYYGEYGMNPTEVVAFVPASTIQANDHSIVAYTQTVYYMSIFFLQLFNHFICKRNYKLPFGMGVFANVYTWWGILGGAIITIVVAYGPGQVIPFHSVRINPLYWLPSIAFGFVLLAYGSLRILYMRSKRPINVNLSLPLDLHPTRWSTRSGN